MHQKCSKVKDRDEPYLVPAMVLALSSEVWRGCLAGSFKEGLAKELQLTDVADATFRILLDFLLPAAASSGIVTDSNVYQLTEISLKYEMPGLKSKCTLHLSSRDISADNVEQRLYLAIKFQDHADSGFFREDLQRCSSACVPLSFF